MRMPPLLSRTALAAATCVAIRPPIDLPPMQSGTPAGEADAISVHAAR